MTKNNGVHERIDAMKLDLVAIKTDVEWLKKGVAATGLANGVVILKALLGI